MSEKKSARYMHDLGNALERFSEVMEISIEENDIALDAAIQRFEFSFELFWKALKALLLEVGGIRISSPRQVLKEAFSLGWINEEQKWLDLLDARNLTSHVYNEQMAHDIYQMIQENAPLMHTEYAALKERFADHLK